MSNAGSRRRPERRASGRRGEPAVEQVSSVGGARLQPLTVVVSVEEETHYLGRSVGTSGIRVRARVAPAGPGVSWPVHAPALHEISLLRVVVGQPGVLITTLHPARCYAWRRAVLATG